MLTEASLESAACVLQLELELEPEQRTVSELKVPLILAVLIQKGYTAR